MVSMTHSEPQTWARLRSMRPSACGWIPSKTWPRSAACAKPTRPPPWAQGAPAWRSKEALDLGDPDEGGWFIIMVDLWDIGISNDNKCCCKSMLVKYDQSIPVDFVNESFSQTHNWDKTMNLLGGWYQFESHVTHPLQNIPKVRDFVAPTWMQASNRYLERAYHEESLISHDINECKKKMSHTFNCLIGSKRLRSRYGYLEISRSLSQLSKVVISSIHSISPDPNFTRCPTALLERSWLGHHRAGLRCDHCHRRAVGVRPLALAVPWALGQCHGAKTMPPPVGMVANGCHSTILMVMTGELLDIYGILIPMDNG